MLIQIGNSLPLRLLNRRRWILCAALFVSTLIIWLDFKSHLYNSAPTVNIVLALTKTQDYSWNSKLTIPNLRLIPFLVNDPTALFHSPANKGREALAYLAYIHQFYDSLPDVSVFVHGDDITWHIDKIFGKSTAHALNLLDLQEVLRRGYLNLRTSWEGGCPAWINTTTSYEGKTSDLFFSQALHESDTLGEKFEEPYMKAAFEENFPRTQAPIILAQPCCSQFAVSREAIRSVPRARYQENMTWLLKTPLSDQLTGRLWEHMWQFLFLGKAKDCVVEHEALCGGWHICFNNQDELDDWNELAEKVQQLKRTASANKMVNEEIRMLEDKLNALRMVAIGRGRAMEQEKLKSTERFK